LITTAIDLQARAIEQVKEKRWWLPIITAFAALVGSIAGGLLRQG
jgi:hypothetical protein